MRNLQPVVVVAAAAVGAFLLLCACPDEPLQELAGGVAGQVCNPVTGRPAAGAEVTAQFTNPATKKDGTKVTTADDNGFFKIGGLPVTAVNLHVKAADEFVNDIPDVQIAALADAQLTDPACRDLPAVPGTGEIVGQICNRHTGAIVTDGTVSVLLADGSELTTNTNPADGSFVLDGVPVGVQIVYVHATGFQLTYRVDVVEGGQTLLEDQQADCSPYPTASTGMIVGIICGTDQPGDPGAPLAGAHVFVVGGIDGIAYEDETIADGTFVIAGVPTPQANLQVRAEKGGFVFTWNAVSVLSLDQAPDGTNLTASVGCQPLSPDDGRSYLVVTGTFDRIELALRRLGINPTLNEGNPLDPTSRWSVSAFGNYDTLASYDAVFVNCGVSDVDFVEGLSATVKVNLKRYVDEGGSLYVSDYGYELIEQVWPDKLNFLGDDTEPHAAEHGQDGTYHLDVVEPGLVDYLGATTIDIGFNFGNFVIVSQVLPSVSTFLKGTVNYRVNGGVSPLPDTPVTVGFNEGLGRVIFTSFHQEGDASRTCTQDAECSDLGLTCVDGACGEQLDGPEDLVLRYLIFSL